MAGVLSLRRAQVKVVGGAAARLKQVEIEGLDAAEVERRIVGALAGARRKAWPRGATMASEYLKRIEEAAAAVRARTRVRPDARA